MLARFPVPGYTYLPHQRGSRARSCAVRLLSG
jgi:hypothetical protein